MLKNWFIVDESKIIKKEDLVECEKCGCLLKKETAYKGKSEIVKHAYWCYSEQGSIVIEEIKENYFCLVHKPKQN